jgi:hypothetical protein
VARHDLGSGQHQSIVDPAHFDTLGQALKERQNPEHILLAGPRLGPEVTEPDVEVRSLEFYEALIRGEA